MSSGQFDDVEIGGTLRVRGHEVPPPISCMLHAVATFDALGAVTYSVDVLNLAGGIEYLGFDDHSADGYLQLNLQLPFPVAHPQRVASLSIHIVPPLPANFLDGTPWLPIPLELGATGTTVALMALTNGKAPPVVPAVTTVGITYALSVAA